MFSTYFSGSLCSIIIITVVTLCSTVIEVTTIPQRQLVAKNNHNSFDDTSLFSYNTLEDGSKWAIPRFPSNHHENITFCRNKQTIRVPVPSNTNVITIPCWTTYLGFQDGSDIMLYKGSPDTYLTPISKKHSQQSGILTFVSNLGFRYNLTSDWTENNSSVLGRYTCFIANSSGENYVIAEYYRDDDSVNIFSSHCSLNYHVNHMGNFSCQVKGVENQTDFQWSFKSMNNKEEIFSTKRKEKYSKDGLVAEWIKVMLPYSNISQVGCRVRRSNSNETFQGFLPIQVQDLEKPIVLNDTTVELYDEPGISLTCSFIAEDTASTHVKWLQDDHKELEGYTIAWTPIRTTTLTGFSSLHNRTKYTCIVSNNKGNSSKSFFIVHKPLPQVIPTEQSANQLVYIYILAALTTLLFLALALEWKKRYEIIVNVKHTLQKLERNDSNSNSPVIQFEEDSTNWRSIGNGAYGQVLRTRVKLSHTDKTVDVVAKSIMWYPTLRRKTAKILFDDFINEITYHGKLNSKNSKDYRKRYIVPYLGFHAPDIRYFRVYLILDYCEPGQLERFLHQYREKRFFNDINGKATIYRYDLRLRQERIRGATCLGISHLMKWAEQIALAMEYLHSLKIVHRDLAARNILLKAPNNYKSIDEVVAQLADFGLSRSVEHSQNYIMNQKLKTKPRNLPVLWYPPESIGFGADVEYTTKSDGWSYGVMLWEMFSLGKHPNEGYKLTEKVQVAPFKKGLETKELELRRSDLKKIPDQIWLLMQRCWELRPENRPDFSEIYQKLKAINLSFGLVATEEELTNADENHDQDASENQDNSPDQMQNLVEVNVDIDHERVLFNHNRNYSKHGLSPVSSEQNQSDTATNSPECSSVIDSIELANAQNISRSHASSSDQLVENQAPVYSNEASKNTFTVLCKNEYVSS